MRLLYFYVFFLFTMPALATKPTTRERIAWQVDYMQEPIFIAGKFCKFLAIGGAVLSLPYTSLYFYYKNKLKNAVEEKDKLYYEEKLQISKYLIFSSAYLTVMGTTVSTLCWYAVRNTEIGKWQTPF